MTELTIYSLAVCEIFQFLSLVESSTFYRRVLCVSIWVAEHFLNADG